MSATLDTPDQPDDEVVISTHGCQASPVNTRSVRIPAWIPKAMSDSNLTRGMTTWDSILGLAGAYMHFQKSWYVRCLFQDKRL